MHYGKGILLASVLFTGCATHQEPTDQQSEASLGPGGLTIATIEPATPRESAATSPEDDKWQRIEEFLARQGEGADSEEIDIEAFLGLWDEWGHFRRDYWESLTHERRQHCVTVLALRGNKGAIRARGAGLSEEELREKGPYIANGSFGAPMRSWLDDGRSGGRASGRVTIKIDPEFFPDWKLARQATIDAAVESGLPLVIYFSPGLELDAASDDLDAVRAMRDSDSAWASPELAKMSRGDAVFIKVPSTEDRDRPPWAEESVVPASKILSDNPAREYAVPLAGETVIVADAYGNEFLRLTKVPQPDELQRWLAKVAELAARANERLQANLDKAQAHFAKGERRDALKYLLKNFGGGVVGVKPQLDSIDVYSKIIEQGRAELSDLVDAGDKVGLQALAREFAKTDLEKEIDEALAKLK